MFGVLYGVGVGPGDPGLMTYNAVKTIEMSDVIVVPGANKEKAVSYKIAQNIVEDLDKKKCICVKMPMVHDENTLNNAHQSAAERIAAELVKGSNVAYLTLGDPTIYSTYIYIKDRVEEMGYKTQFVSGIPSFCAASALINECLTKKTEQLHILPLGTDFEEIQKLSGTKVLMKSASKILELKQFLQVHQLNATMIVNCGMENEQVYYGVHNFPDEVGYYALIIIKDED